MSPYTLGLIALIVAAETAAMSCLKKGVQDYRWFAAGLGFYAIVSVLLTRTFALEGLALTNALWSAASIMATTTVGVLAFKEALHAHDFFAIGMIGAGVLILKYTD